MTLEQKTWLDEHPAYSIVGAGGASPGGLMTQDPHYEVMGALMKNGTFIVRKAQPGQGDLLVGIRKPPRRDAEVS